ncbi:uncharacterized protein METZ01_LOCUS118311, partial [marine metagenome]
MQKFNFSVTIELGVNNHIFFPVFYIYITK